MDRVELMERCRTSDERAELDQRVEELAGGSIVTCSGGAVGSSSCAEELPLRESRPPGPDSCSPEPDSRSSRPDSRLPELRRRTKSDQCTEEQSAEGARQRSGDLGGGVAT
nr:unnamed protein product [Digitaria exilis]